LPITFRSLPGSANTIGPTVRTTDASGAAVLCYTGTTGGTDHIIGFYDANGNTLDDDGVPTVAASIHWVVPLTIIGFLRPVDNSSAGVVNIAKAGSTVPLKFQVLDQSGAYVSDLSIVQSFTAGKVACDSTDIPEDVITTTGGTSLRYDFAASQFVQNWKTPSTPGQCYRVTVTFTGDQKLIADFRLR